MKRFSLSNLREGIVNTFLRFPLTLVFAVTDSISIICQYREDETYLFSNWNTTLYLGMLLTLAFALFAEEFKLGRRGKITGYVICILLLAGYYWSLPYVPHDISTFRFWLITLGLHLLVSFAPFIESGKVNGMWQFNKSLFLRFLLAALYTGVLYSGLALALLGIDELLEIRVPSHDYFYLWVFLAGIFNTWFFLAGIPGNISSLDEETNYPKGLKIFTVYVLLPLVTIYLVIIYLYILKIFTTPNKSLLDSSWLVIWLSVFGILSFLLVYPLRKDEENKWVIYFSRLFYFLLVPLSVLLLNSVAFRISQYGFTENRYFGLLLFCWLTFISAYSILTRGRNIKIIPLSLCLICFLFCFGPWGIFSVSERSQVKRLSHLLIKNKILVNGKIDTLHEHTVVNKKDYQAIYGLIEYLNDRHGYKSLERAYDMHLKEDLSSNKQYTSVGYNEQYKPDEEIVMMRMHIMPNDVNNYDNEVVVEDTTAEAEPEPVPEVKSSFYISWREMTDVSGYRYSAKFNISDVEDDDDIHQTFILKNDSVHLSYNINDKQFEVRYKNFKPLYLSVKNILKLYGTTESNPSQETLSIRAGNGQWKVKIIVTGVRISDQNDSHNIRTLEGVLLIN